MTDRRPRVPRGLELMQSEIDQLCGGAAVPVL